MIFMKKILCLITAVTASLLSANAQDSCRVLIKNIALEYTGSCRKGLADGPGEAKGATDSYSGNFRKGLPDGKGVYHYSDTAIYDGLWLKGMRHGQGSLSFRYEGKDTVQTGYWHRDTYMGIRFNEAAYRIVQKRNIERLRVYRQSDGNAVYFSFRISGNPQISDLDVSGSSGLENSWSDQPGFRECEFPFTGKIRFQAWNKLQTMRYDIYVEVEILEPGFWYIELSL